MYIFMVLTQEIPNTTPGTTENFNNYIIFCRQKETLYTPHVKGIDPTRYLHEKQISHHRESQQSK